MAWKKEYEKVEKQVKESTDKKLKDVEEIYKQQVADATKAINLQKQALPDEYRPLYDASEVQKIVDRRNIMNRMANLGATQSGMSDSLSTAVELSAGNRVQALNAQQRAALDKLTQTLLDLQSKSATDLAARQSDIRSQADEYLASTKTSMYNAYQQAQAQKAAAEAQERAKRAELAAKLKQEQEKNYYALVDKYAQENTGTNPYVPLLRAQEETGYMPEQVQAKMRAEWEQVYSKFRSRGYTEDMAAAYANYAVFDIPIPREDNIKRDRLSSGKYGETK
jgi:hypothetical protein